MTASPYKFCARCGGKLTWRTEQAGEPRRQTCVRCGFILYQNSGPCVDALIVRNGKILLVRRKQNPQKGWLDIPGGYLEYGELPEIGVAREAKEEVGLTFKPQRLIGTYISPYTWQGFRRYNLILSYYGTAVGTPKAGDDAAAVEWHDLNNLPRKLAFSHQLPSLRALKKYLKTR